MSMCVLVHLLELPPRKNAKKEGGTATVPGMKASLEPPGGGEGWVGAGPHHKAGGSRNGQISEGRRRRGVWLGGFGFAFNEKGRVR